MIITVIFTKYSHKNKKGPGDEEDATDNNPAN